MTATLRWAYYDAARLEGYTITRDDTTWRASGRIVWSDAFKLKQQPLYFIAPHARGFWEWPIVDYGIADGRLTATLGPPIERM